MAVNWKKLVKAIPAQVQVKPKLFYDVVWCIEFPRDVTQVGETNHEKKQINIKKGMSPKLTVVTYLHEVLHLSDNYNANLTEAQILALEPFFYYILKEDNIFKK